MGSQSYATPGTYTFTVPDGVSSLAVDIASASGGQPSMGTQTLGKGGRIVATLPVTPGEALTVIVGAVGGSASLPGAGGAGGGTGGDGGWDTIHNRAGGGGGGSSEVKRGSSRLLVPGAGGGCGYGAQGWNGGGVGNGAGTAGATTTGPGGNGSGANGGSGPVASSSSASVGGGGAGWFGGGAGGSTQIGGSGGAGHADASCTGVTGTDGFQSGNGYVTFTWSDAPAFSGSFAGTVEVSASFSGHDSTQIGDSFSAEADVSLSFTGTKAAHGGFTATASASLDVTGTAHLPFLGPDFVVEVALDGSAGSVVADDAWTDITEWVQSFQTKRGRSTEVDAVEEGTLTLVLDNADGRFTPGKTSSPYYPKWTPRRPIRVRTVANDVTPAATIFTGSIVDASTEIAADAASTCTVSATDAIGALSRKPLPSAALAEILALGPVALYPLTDGDAAREFGNAVAGSDIPPLLRDDSDVGPGTIEGGGDSIMVGFPNESSAMFTNSTHEGATAVPNSVLYTDHPACVPSSGPWSMHAWVQVEDTSQIEYVFACFQGSGTTGMFALFSTAGSIGLNLGGQQASLGNVTSDPFMVAVTVAADGTGVLYFNGVPQSGTTPVGPQGLPPAGSRLYIGGLLGAAYQSAEPTADPDSYYFGFTGGIEGVAFYDRVLSGAEIADLWDASQDGMSGETSTVRIGAILDAAGWPVELRDIEADSTAMGPRPWAQGDNPYDVARTSGADALSDMYATPDGKIATLTRTTRQALASSATLSETAGTAVEAPLTVRVTEDDVINDVTVKRTNGVNHRLTDPDSIATYGDAAQEYEVNLALDADAITYGQTILATYAQPNVRTDAVTMKVVSNESWGAATSLDFGKRITLADLPASAPADSIDFFVESVAHDVTIGGEFVEWVTTFELSPVELYGAS